MAFCTQCGAVHHDEDKHTCKNEDVPKKGEIMRLNGLKEVVQN